MAAVEVFFIVNFTLASKNVWNFQWGKAPFRKMLLSHSWYQKIAQNEHFKMVQKKVPRPTEGSSI